MSAAEQGDGDQVGMPPVNQRTRGGGCVGIGQLTAAALRRLRCNSL